MKRKYSLSERQQKLFEELEAKLQECVYSGIHFFDYYGEICAVNGDIVNCVAADDTLDAPLDWDQVSSISKSSVDLNPMSEDHAYVRLQVAPGSGQDD